METKPLSSIVSTLSIFIDTFDGVHAGGRLYSHYLDTQLPFLGLEQVLLMGDALFDELEFPQEVFSRRTFFRHEELDSTGKRVKAMQEKSATNQIPPKDGDKATFIVKVMFRQNATWQGTVTWADESRTQSFRSTLELIRLIEDAIGSSDISWQE